MEEKSITHEDSLKIIETMIETAKKKVTRLDSYYSLMWGYLVLIASLLNYYLLTAGYGQKASYAWFLMFIGGLASIWISIRRNKQRKVRTYFDKVLFYLWMGFIICIFIVVFNGKYVSYQITPLILLLYGIALLVNGGIFNFKPQIIGAIVAWIGCFVAFRLEYKDQLLIEAAVVLISYIIPGHLLYNMAQKMFKELDPIIHSQLRLAVMSILAGVESAEFVYLKEKTNATAGNLSVQLDKLQQAGYISIEKTFKGKYPLTRCKITLAGAEAFKKYVNDLQSYIKP